MCGECDHLLEGAEACVVVNANMPRAIVAGGYDGAVKLRSGAASSLVDK